MKGHEHKYIMGTIGDECDFCGLLKSTIEVIEDKQKSGITEQDLQNSALFSNFAQRVKMEWLVEEGRFDYDRRRKVQEKDIDALLLIAWNNMKREIQGARAEAFKEMEEAQRIKETGNLAPMGASQWRNHGRMYKYDEFFEGKIRKEERENMAREVVEEVEGLKTNCEKRMKKEEKIILQLEHLEKYDQQNNR